MSANKSDDEQYTLELEERGASKSPDTEKKERKRSKKGKSTRNVSDGANQRDLAIGSLLFAVSKGELPTVLQILQSGDVSVDDGDYDRRAAIHIATADGHLDILRAIVAAGGNVNLADRWGNTPLDEATRHGHDECATFLRQNGARHGTGVDFGMELLKAVSKGDIEEVRKLIKTGISVNSCDYDKRTALHVAVGSRNIEMIQYLLEQGADLDATDVFGQTPVQEAQRVGVRTGDDPVMDTLRAAQTKDPNSPLHFSESASHRFRNGYLVFAIIVQIVIGVLYAIFTEYDTEADGHQAQALGATTVWEYYGFYMDVHVMIFIGFGFLMTFLRKFGYSSVGVNFLIAVLAIEWYLLVGPFWEKVFDTDFTERIHISIGQLIRADFAAGAVLISFGALLGKTSPLQMICLTIIEVFFYALNEEIGIYLGIADIGGSMTIHTFGAYFGLAASFFMTPAGARGNKDNSAVYRSDLFAMIGTIFLFIYWPSFNAAFGIGNTKHRAVVNTVLSLSASAFTAFFATQLWRNDHKFNMVDIQNATLAGGVAMGASANMVIHPSVAILIGTFAGFVSCFGFARLQGLIERKIGLHDTCGVHNLHGMPGIIGAIASAIAASVATDDNLYACRYGNNDVAAQIALGCVNDANLQQGNTVGAVYPNSGQLYNVFPDRDSRSASKQAGLQIAYLFITLAIAIVTGSMAGLVLKRLNRPKKYFVDDQAWEVPERETPYYFDERGEINRDAHNRPVSENSPHERSGPNLNTANAQLEDRIQKLEAQIRQMAESQLGHRNQPVGGGNNNDVGAAATIMLLQNLNAKVDSILSDRRN